MGRLADDLWSARTSGIERPVPYVFTADISADCRWIRDAIVDQLADEIVETL